MTQANRQNPDLLTTKQVARLLKIKVREVREAIRDNRIDAFMEGGQYWIRAEHVDDFVLAGDDLIRVGDHVGVREEKKDGEYVIRRWRLAIVESVKSITRVHVRYIDDDNMAVVSVKQLAYQSGSDHKRLRWPGVSRAINNKEYVPR